MGHGEQHGALDILPCVQVNMDAPVRRIIESVGRLFFAPGGQIYPLPFFVDVGFIHIDIHAQRLGQGVHDRQGAFTHTVKFPTLPVKVELPFLLPPGLLLHVLLPLVGFLIRRPLPPVVDGFPLSGGQIPGKFRVLKLQSRFITDLSGFVCLHKPGGKVNCAETVLRPELPEQRVGDVGGRRDLCNGIVQHRIVIACKRHASDAYALPSLCGKRTILPNGFKPGRLNIFVRVRSDGLSLSVHIKSIILLDGLQSLVVLARLLSGKVRDLLLRFRKALSVVLDDLPAGSVLSGLVDIRKGHPVLLNALPLQIAVREIIRLLPVDLPGLRQLSRRLRGLLFAHPVPDETVGDPLHIRGSNVPAEIHSVIPALLPKRIDIVTPLRSFRFVVERRLLFLIAQQIQLPHDLLRVLASLDCGKILPPKLLTCCLSGNSLRYGINILLLPKLRQTGSHSLTYDLRVLFRRRFLICQEHFVDFRAGNLLPLLHFGLNPQRVFVVGIQLQCFRRQLLQLWTQRADLHFRPDIPDGASHGSVSDHLPAAKHQTQPQAAHAGLPHLRLLILFLLAVRIKNQQIGGNRPRGQIQNAGAGPLLVGNGNRLLGGFLQVLSSRVQRIFPEGCQQLRNNVFPGCLG